MTGLQFVGITAAEAAERQLEHERREIAGAIAMVGEANFPSVVVANLAHCQAVVDELRPLADAMGVRLRLIGHAHDVGCDVVVSRA